MARKERSFAAKLAHEQRKKEAKICPKCNTPVEYIVLYEARYKDEKNWAPVRKNVDLCNCNKEWVYNQNK